MKKIKVGIYGFNGHQIVDVLRSHPHAEITAISFGYKTDRKIKNLPESVKYFDTLEEMLSFGDTELISLCSPSREMQEKDAIFCLKAGKHVYAEKPSALSEDSLDKILLCAKENGCEFHEMADTVFHEPYFSARKLVKSGKIGNIVQIYAQKSYPSNFNSRPQNETDDGGLIRWVSIHALRFVEHISGLKVNEISAYETHLGNTRTDGEGIFTAASLAITLENGGVASVCLNYLKPHSFPLWGNECVRIFGDKGFIEITDGGKHTHIYTDTDEGEINTEGSGCVDYFDIILKHLLFGDALPLSEDEEFHPLRAVIRAKECAKTVK